MKAKVFNIYKPSGLTPLQALEKFKRKYPEYKDQPATYLGRLDPLAEGVLLVMVGEHTQEDREKYLNLEKTYEAEIMFGFATDTFDVLGLVTEEGKVKISAGDIHSMLKSLVGRINLPLPVYSSVPVKGKPLFEWSRAGKLVEVEIPKREMEIRSIKFLSTREISAPDLLTDITSQILQVEGDFRQEEIRQKWQGVLEKHKPANFTSVKLEIECSSGTYIRSFADELGKKLGTSAVLLKLTRTKVGEFEAAYALKLV